MAARRTFYVTQDELVVWHERRGGWAEEERFTSSDEGFHDFAVYLRAAADEQSLLLVDVIEEEFSADTIPKLPPRDRAALIDRRLERKYSRTPYRLGHFQGKSRAEATEQEVLYSAVSNHELLDPWLEMLTAQRTPLVGIFSVPLLAPALLAKLRKPAGNALLLTQHQGIRLRQMFLRDGKLKSARLSQSPAISDPGYGAYIFDEILRSRRYLERSRLLGGMEEIDAYMITDSDTAEAIIASDKGRVPLHFHFIKPESAARALGVAEAPPADHLEALFIASVARGRRGHNYAIRGETRYHRFALGRRLLVGTALAASMACSIVAGLNLTEAWGFRRSIAVMDQQIQQMEETFRRENERFAPVQADSHEMKLAVDTGDFILRNRLPVAWVMQQLGGVLGDFPEIQIDQLEWRAEAAGADNPTQQARRGGPPPAVPIKPVQTVRAELAAQVMPFDGDMRRAFAEIDRLAAALETRTAFERVAITQFPFDASPTSAISGEVVNLGSEQTAYFRMSLELQIGATEQGDDTG